jgi:hypothetical protein
MKKIPIFTCPLLFEASLPLIAQPTSSINFHYLKAEQRLSHNHSTEG